MNNRHPQVLASSVSSNLVDSLLGIIGYMLQADARIAQTMSRPSTINVTNRLGVAPLGEVSSRSGTPVDEAGSGARLRWGGEMSITEADPLELLGTARPDERPWPIWSAP